MHASTMLETMARLPIAQSVHSNCDNLVHVLDADSSQSGLDREHQLSFKHAQLINVTSLVRPSINNHNPTY